MFASSFVEWEGVYFLQTNNVCKKLIREDDLQMGLAVRKNVPTECTGVSKEVAEKIFQKLNEQVRILDQKMTMKVDLEVMGYFHARQYEIQFTRDLIQKIKK